MMPKGHPLSEELRRAICYAYASGERRAEIASRYGLAANTVSRVINEQKEAGSMSAREKIVAGDKANGRLVSGNDPRRYEGTCIVGGKCHTKTFIADNARKATEMWETWCAELGWEQEQEQEPEIEIRPWRDVAEERQRRIEELEKRVAELEAATTEPTDKPVYVLWAKTDTPKLYGVYQHMSGALDEVDKLNEVAAFLGAEGAFEVEEATWKG